MKQISLTTIVDEAPIVAIVRRPKVDPKYLFVTGITPALSASNRKLTFDIVKRFRAAGTKVVFDPNMRFRLWSPKEARVVFLELAQNCDVLIPSLTGRKS